MTPSTWDYAMFPQRVAWCRQVGYDFVRSRKLASHRWSRLTNAAAKKLMNLQP